MTEITDLSPTDASNTAVTGESLQGNVANMGRMENTLQAILGMVGRWTSSDTLASAATTDIGAQPEAYLTISGTTTITSFGTVRAGTVRFLRFSGALTLTHNATSLILPGAANITTVAGDTAIFVSEGSGNWRCVDYIQTGGLSELRSVEAPVVTDADTLLTSGWYRTGSSWTGSPYAGTDSRNQGYLRVSSFASGTGEVLQEWTPIRASNGRRFRLFEAGTPTNWFLRYSSKNLLGTVDQSSGVPTGAVIETGTNANGTYTRWADGTQICTKSLNIGSVGFSASGNIYISSAQAGGDYAVSFSGAPVVPAPAVVSSTGTVWATLATVPAGSSFPSFYLFNSGSGTSTGTTLLLTAIGRWF